MDKRQWRATAQAERSRLDVDSAAHRRFLAPFLVERVPADRYIVSFDAMAGEVDLGPLVAGHPDPERRFALTRTPGEGHRLTVHPIGSPMERHRFGYVQPTAAAPELADDSIGAVLVPGLAFDRTGVRLGRGKGYYDRFLARLPPGVLFIGITAGYVVERLPSEPFDVVMTHLATETGVHAVPPAADPADPDLIAR